MDKKVKNILIVIGIVLCLIFFMIYITSNQNSEEKKPNTKKEEIDQYYNENRDKFDFEMMKNVEAKGIVLKDNSLLIEVTNLNDYLAHVKVYIEFFDENGESITMDDRYIGYVEAGQKSYNEIYMSEELRNLYKTFRIVAVPSYSPSIVSYYHDVELISFDQKDGTIQYKIKSDTKDSIDVEWGILYYDEEGQIVDYSTANQYDVKANKKITDKAYLSYGTYNKKEAVLLEVYSYE